MIHSIWLKSFRCLAENTLSFDTSPFISVISENSTGKSSLLDACYVLGHLSSLFTQSLVDVVGFGQPAAYMGIKIGHQKCEYNYYLKVDSVGKKYITLNNAVVRTKADIQQLFRVNYISSDSLFYVNSQPLFRRNKLDNSLMQLSAGYRKNSSSYKRLIHHKNRLLKQGGGDSVLRSLNHQLAPLMVAIQMERIRYLSRIETVMNRLIPFGHIPIDRIDIRYSPLLGERPEAVEAYLQSQLPREKVARCSLVGPHRDDYFFYTNGAGIKLFCSRGVCRIIAYYFQLSQSIVLKDTLGLPLLLLLDEPFSEIFPALKHQLIAQIPREFYCLYTSTQLNEMDSLHKTPMYGITNGRLWKR
jgi:DNA replication and repair protein RecF